MEIPPLDLVGRVPHKFSNNPLVDASGREVGDEAVPIRVEADFEPVPLAIEAPRGVSEWTPKKSIGLMDSQLPILVRMADYIVSTLLLVAPLGQN